MIEDYWLCWVVQPHKEVQADTTVQGIDIRGGDGYAIVQWMECTSSDERGRVFQKEDIETAVLFAVGAVVPIRVGAMPAGGESIGITMQKHDEIMARLQPNQ